MECLTFSKMESGLNMFRSDVVMTPLRVKQAIDSRFVKPSEDELNVLINGTWVEFVKVVNLPPHVDCSQLLTMYKGDTTLIETPVINAENCTSLSEAFRDCINLERVGYIHCPNVTNMYRMFYYCKSLTEIPMLDTSSVTDMGNMFRGCSSLTTIPSLDTSSVTNMSYMFRGCLSLTTIPMLDTSNVTYMSYMFYLCRSLTSVTFVGDVVPPYGTDMFASTPINEGNGFIFVPDHLVQEYRTASGWSNHASVIFGHSEKENMTSQIQQMTAMNIENKPSEEELQLMMQEFEDEELM